MTQQKNCKKPKELQKKSGAVSLNSKHRNLGKKKWYTHRDLNPKPSGP